MDASSDFIAKFRATLANNGMQASKLPTRRDMVMENRQKTKEEAQMRQARAEHAADQQKWLDEQVQKTAPLREAIKQVSGGTITVDKSIYDETELNRILDSVKNMQEFGGGALQPGYNVISDSQWLPENISGIHMTKISRNSDHWPVPIKIHFPKDNLGSKNAPYQIYIKNANDVEENDWGAVLNYLADWAIEKYDKDSYTAESATHTHELSHGAQKDAMKKTTNPAMTLNYAEKLARQMFKDNNPSLQEIFDIAAKNTGFKNLKDAAYSISRYAGEEAEEESERGGRDASKDWSADRRLPDVFAEAYTDVLYNKDNASPYSKELISLYVDYINNYNKNFSSAMPRQDNGLLNLPRTENQSEFMKNLREMYFGPKK